MEQALMATDVMQARVKKLTAEPEFAALKAKFDSLQSDLQSLEQEFQSNKMTWSDADKQGQRIKAEAKQKELRVILQSLKQQEQVAMKSVMQELGPKAKTALQQITTAQDIDIVLARNAALWRTESSDITAELTQRLNKAK
jgi:outer membrane protein